MENEIKSHAWNPKLTNIPYIGQRNTNESQELIKLPTLWDSNTQTSTNDEKSGSNSRSNIIELKMQELGDMQGS